VTAVPFVTAFATEAGPTSTATISIPLPSSPLPLPASFNVDELDDGTEPRWTPPVAAGSLAEVPVQRGTEPDAEPSTEPDAEPDTEPRTEQDAEPNTELASDAPHTPAVIRQAYALAAPHDPGNIPAQGPTDGASQPTPGRAESLFSGFRSRRDARDAAPVEQSIGLAPPVSEATLAPIARPEPPPLEPIALLEPIPPPQPAPPNLDDWFDAAAAMGADAPGWEPWEEDLGPQDTADDPQQAADDPQQAADDTQEPADEPRSATLTAPFNILPQRTSIRTALGRGRRRRSEQQSGSADAPFSGGFDLLGPARDFAQQEGFGPSVDSGTQPVSTGLPTQPNGVPAVAVATAGSPIPSQARESSSGRARGSVGDDALQGDRSALTSQALTELSRLSAYNPTSLPPADRGGLERRTPAAPAPPQPEAEVETSGQRARTAADVRSMLTGFNAGVERGRTSPSAHRPASERPPEEEVRADQPESAGSATGRSEADRIAHGQPVSDQSTGDQPLGVEPAADPSAPRPPRKGAWGSLPQRRHTDPGARDE
jgi:hypothetical protein